MAAAKRTLAIGCVIDECTNPPRGVRLPRPASGYTDLIPAVANVAFDGVFHYRCSHEQQKTFRILCPARR